MIKYFIIFVIICTSTPVFAICSDATNINSCLTSLDNGCAWCSDNDKCGVYDPCDFTFSDDLQTYKCSNVTLGSNQPSCYYYENINLSLCFLIILFVILVTCSCVCICFRAYDRDNTCEKVSMMLLVTYFMFGIFCVILGGICWIVLITVSDHPVNVYYTARYFFLTYSAITVR